MSLDRRLLQGIDDRRVSFSENLLISRFKSMEKSYKSSPKVKGKSERNWSGSKKSGRSAAIDASVDSRDVAVSSETLNDSTEDVNRRREDVVSDGSSSSDEKPSLRDDASLSSHDTSFEKKRKKKWTIKLPWKKKNKTRYEDPPSVSETSSSHTEDESSSDAFSVSSAQEDVIKPNSSKEESPQMGKRKGASSWYGFKTNQSSENVGKSTDSVDDGANRRDDGPQRQDDGAIRLDGRSNDSVDDGAHHCDVTKDGPKKTKRPTYNFHYSSSSESEPEIFPPSKPYHKRVKEKNKKLPRNVDVTQSSLDLMPSGSQLNKSTQEEEKEFSDPGSQASPVRDETESSQEVARSSKRTEPKIKKSYSLPSIFFRRNKKKKREMEQRKYESRKYDSHKDDSDGENFSDSDSQQQQSGPSKSDSMKIRMKNRSSYVETPLVFVGKEKPPTLKSWAPTENIFQREYANNVETVDSIFKRSSYKRVYKNRETSSITYPSKVQGEKKIAKGFDSDSTDSQHSPKNTRLRSSTVTVEAPSTSSAIQETSLTNTKKQVSASQTPATRLDQLALPLKEPIKSSVRRSGKEHKIDAEKKKVKEYVDPKKSPVENLHKKDKPKVLETKAEVNYNRKELELKEKQDMTRNSDVLISKATEADNAFSNRKKPQPDEKENTVKQFKSKATIVSKREDIFEKSLNRDLQEAKKTVQDVNDQFGQSIFTRNYRASTVSSSPTSVIKEQNSQNDKKSLTATLPTMSNHSKSSRGTKSKRRDRDHDPLIRRRSYEEMINQLEDEMFDSDDSSDTDIDQIDLSFKKPHMEAKVDFEIIKNISDKEKRSSKLLSSDDDSGGEEHIYHIRVVPSGKLAPTEKKSPEIVRPLSYPPPPPSVIYSMTSKEEKHLHLVQDKSSYTKEDSSSQGYLSSNEEDGEIIYANTNVKKKKKTKLKDRENNEINQLLDESIKKYVRTDSPPNFSPPVIIPEPKFSPGLNDRSVYSIIARQLPETKIDSLKDQEHTTAIQTANKLLLQRKQQRISNFKDEFNSKNLPIKNIKSLRSNNTFLPPPPPSLPPPEEDPFWLPSKRVNQTISQNSPTKSHSLSISHGPTISYSPSQETVDAARNKSLNKYSEADPLPSSTAAGSQNKLMAGQGLSSSLSSFDVEFHDPPVIMSPVLLKAEIVDRGNKSISVLDLKREFVGPYKVSPLESSKNQDTRKQAVSFCFPSDEEQKESEQIYVNQQPPKMRDSLLIKNSSLPTQSFTQKETRQHSQNSMQEKNILNNQTRSQEKHITHNQVLRQENKSLSSGTKTMMKENTPNRNEISNQSESTLHLHNPNSGSMKTSVNQYNTYPYSKTEGYSNMLRTAHQSQPDELKSPSMVKQENLSLTRMRGTPLAYEAETVQHSKNILRSNVRPAFSPPMAPVDLNKMYNVKVAPITVVPNQRPPLKSILRKTNVPKTNFPQVLSPQPPISNLVTRYNDSDVERVKLNTTSSESGSPPAIPDYPPPPPRKMTEVQQIFIESLLHPSEEQSSGALLTKRDPDLGHTALVHPRSRVPYIDQSRSEFNSPYIMGSQKISQSNKQQRTYQHYVESYPHRPHLSQSHTPMMGTLDFADRSESNWNKLREQIRHEESIYQNYGLKTDV